MERISNLSSWFAKTHEQRIAILEARDPDRVRRHEEALARQSERCRRNALAAYRAGRLKNHLRDRLRRAALRMLKPRPVEPVSRLVAAAGKVVKRHNKHARAKIIRLLRRRLENSVLHLKAGRSKSKTARDLLGCDLDFLRQHLEKQFRSGMAWNNHGYHGWHVDHIRPLASFDLNQPEQAAQAFHWSNLQPLWAKENMDKRDKTGCGPSHPVIEFPA